MSTKYVNLSFWYLGNIYNLFICILIILNILLMTLNLQIEFLMYIRTLVFVNVKFKIT